MNRRTSLVARVALGSAVAASAAALLVALATIAMATWLIRSAEDRRLEEAAVTFALDLDKDGTDLAAIERAHHDESEEMGHTGLLFAVFDAAGHQLAGDRRLGLPSSTGCATLNAETLRVCRAPSTRGLMAVVGATHVTMLPALALAAIISAFLAAALAWVASRPISRWVIAPLTRLGDRINTLDVGELSSRHLGPPEGVFEVDALRNTIEQLLVRVERALALAHRFAANASHELRTPLTAVRGELELLAEKLADQTLKADAGRASQKLDELNVLVERLLVLSVPTRAAEHTREIISIRDLLEDTVAALPQSQQLRVSVTDADGLVNGDAALLSTLFANALSNGLKFGSHVTTRMTTSAGVHVIHIDDDGPGIASAEREQVFEPFYRADEALRSRLPGHGLGLALIRHVARMFGGDANFTDKPDRGARLEIRLPAAV